MYKIITLYVLIAFKLFTFHISQKNDKTGTSIYLILSLLLFFLLFFFSYFFSCYFFSRFIYIYKKITRNKYLIIYFINFKAFIYLSPDIYPMILLDFLYNILFPYYTL